MNFPTRFVLSFLPAKRSVASAAGFLAACLLVLLLAPSAFAGGMWVHGRYWPDAPPRKPYHPPFEVIEAVNVGARTVTIGHRRGNDHSHETLRVTEITEITVNGARKDLKALRKGMRVDVTHGTDTSEASRLVIGKG